MFYQLSGSRALDMAKLQYNELITSSPNLSRVCKMDSCISGRFIPFDKNISLAVSTTLTLSLGHSETQHQITPIVVLNSVSRRVQKVNAKQYHFDERFLWAMHTTPVDALK